MDVQKDVGIEDGHGYRALIYVWLVTAVECRYLNVSLLLTCMYQVLSGSEIRMADSEADKHMNTPFTRNI